MKKWIGTIALALVCSACIGTYPTFNKLRDWNEEVSDNEWGQEGVHLAFWILPVYPLALLGDILIFNSIEFWDGE